MSSFSSSTDDWLIDQLLKHDAFSYCSLEYYMYISILLSIIISNAPVKSFLVAYIDISVHIYFDLSLFNLVHRLKIFVPIWITIWIDMNCLVKWTIAMKEWSFSPFHFLKMTKGHRTIILTVNELTTEKDTIAEK